MTDVFLLLDSYVNGHSLKFFLAEISNYLFLFSILSVLFLLEKVNKTEYLFFCLYCLSPFLINYVLFEPSYFIDQRSYLICTSSLKDGMDLFDNQFCGYTFNPLSRQVANASMLYSLIPMPTFLTVVAGAFMNKFLIIFFYVFYLKNRIIHENLIFIFLIPSFFLYSSLFLRDLPIVLASCIILIELLRGRWTSTLLVVLMLAFITFTKPQNLIILGVFTSILLITRLFKGGLGIFAVSIVFFIFVSILLQDTILATVNFYLRAFAVEEGYSQDSLAIMFEYSSIFSLILSAIPNFFKASFAPYLWNTGSLFQIAQSLENIFLSLFVYFLVYKGFTSDRKITKVNFLYLTFYFFVIGMVMYGTIIFNDGSLVRYKFSILMPFIISAIYLVFNKISIHDK